MYETPFDKFIGLSVQLTAFTKFQLLGTGEAQSYFDTVNRVVGKSIIDELLDVFIQIESEANGDQAIFEGLLRAEILSDEKFGPVTRSIIKMWFIGTWFQLPISWSEKFGARSNDETFVVSSKAYMEGLLWPTIGSHPMGAKAPGYGTWAAPPDIPPV